MDYTKENPAALSASANRVQGIKASQAVDNLDPNENLDSFQAAVIIASRFHLSPVRSRLICHLAGIGRTV